MMFGRCVTAVLNVIPSLWAISFVRSPSPLAAAQSMKANGVNPNGRQVKRIDNSRPRELLERFETGKFNVDAFREEVRQLNDADLRKLSAMIVKRHRENGNGLEPHPFVPNPPCTERK
jgi:hypothetical protein